MGDDVADLADLSMPELLVVFGTVEPVGDDLRLTDDFRDRWRQALDTLDAREPRVAALADLYDEPIEIVDIEYRVADGNEDSTSAGGDVTPDEADTRPFALVGDRAAYNWISDAAMLADLAAHRAIDDERWTPLDRNDRTRVLKSFRVVLDECPVCRGSVMPTNDVVESCCRDWDVIAVRCTDCMARVVELPPPDTGGDHGGSDPVPPRTGGFTR